MNALARFGEQALPAVLDVVRSPGSHYDEVNHGLITLRFMVESRRTALSPVRVAQIRQVARQRLTGDQDFSTLWRAIDLAGALKDPELNQVLERLATDRASVMAVGVTDTDRLAKTQQRAKAGLAGSAALPRPDF